MVPPPRLCIFIYSSQMLDSLARAISDTSFWFTMLAIVVVCVIVDRNSATGRHEFEEDFGADFED